jgi:hypothetical protein
MSSKNEEGDRTIYFRVFSASLVLGTIGVTLALFSIFLLLLQHSSLDVGTGLEHLSEDVDDYSDAFVMSCGNCPLKLVQSDCTTKGSS